MSAESQSERHDDLEMDCDDGWSMMWMYLMALNVQLKLKWGIVCYGHFITIRAYSFIKTESVSSRTILLYSSHHPYDSKSYSGFPCLIDYEKELLGEKTTIKPEHYHLETYWKSQIKW